MKKEIIRPSQKKTGGIGDHRAPSLWITILLAMVIAIAFQGTRGLYETTEGRYAECAREMTVSGNYLEPTLHFQPHWTKPPLAYWSIATGIHLFGNNAWGARAMLIPAFVLTVLAVGFLGRLMWNSSTGRWSALIYATSLFPLVTMNALSTDVLLTCFLAWALVAFWKGLRTGRSLFFVLMWAAFGAAFLTKGPPSLLFLLGVVPTWYLYRRREPGTPGLLPLAGLAAFIVIGLGWYLYEAWIHPGLASYWLGYETLGRLTNGTGEFHNSGWTRAFTLYGPVLLLGALPWGPIVMSWKKPTVERLRSGLRGLLSGPEKVFLTLTFFPVLTIFALARSRLPLYVLPLFTILSLAMGQGLAKAITRGRRKTSTVCKVALVMMLFIVSLKGTAGYMTKNSGDMQTLSRRLDAAMTEQKLEAANLAVLSHRKLYGLDFYENRVLPRVSLSEEKLLPGQVTVTREPEKLAALLVERRNLKPLEKRLGPLPEPRIISLTDRWDLFLFDDLVIKGQTVPTASKRSSDKESF